MIKEKKKPIISVIIPTYNRARFLERAINSVLKQTYQNFELIIVDDCSTDDTESIIKNFIDERIVYIKLKKNSGSSVLTRNKGIKVAKGEYVAFLDSDDEWISEKLQKQIELFTESNNFNLGFVSCNAIYIYEKENRILNRIIQRPKDVFKKLLEANFIPSASSVLIKKEVFNTIGLFDRKIKGVQDWDMWIRISQKYAFDFVPESLLKYYIHNSNITNELSLKTQMRASAVILQKYREYYELNSFIYSIRIRDDGIKYLLFGKNKIGRKYFLDSIYKNPFNFRSYFYFFLSFFGPSLYYRLTLIKKRIKQVLFIRN
jgi:glycosyltransferase involved in cell wall biosynthesis